MTPGELAELLRRGEDSTLEFKRDDVQNHDLARELAAFLNLAGGTVLLGVDDSGAIVGSTRDADRLEVTSPGKLPNTVTPEGMRRGLCYARNQTLVNVMRDYAYREARGMGIRNTIIPGMRAHNGTAPELIAEEHRFIVRLLKAPIEKSS